MNVQLGFYYGLMPFLPPESLSRLFTTFKAHPDLIRPREPKVEFLNKFIYSISKNILPRTGKTRKAMLMHPFTNEIYDFGITVESVLASQSGAPETF